MNARYNQIATDDIPATRTAIDRIEASLADRQRRRREEHRGATVASLLRLLASLRDPYDNRHDDLIHRGVRNLEIRTATHRNCLRSWIDYAIRFEFRIDDGERNVVLPVHTTDTHRNVFDLDTIASDVLDQLTAAPTTYADVAPTEPVKTAQRIAKILGVGPRRLMLSNITDPRLAHLAALLLTTDDPEVVAEDTGEPLELLQRIHHLHRHATRAVWRTHPSRVRALWYHHGHTGQPVGPAHLVPDASASWNAARARLYEDPNRDQWGLHGPDGYTLRPCPHCGSNNRTPLLIPEPDGLLCTDCRRDQAGFTWPADPYDRYLEMPQLGPVSPPR